MHFFDDMRLGGRLSLALLAALTVTAALVAVSLAELARMDAAAEQAAANHRHVLALARELRHEGDRAAVRTVTARPSADPTAALDALVERSARSAAAVRLMSREAYLAARQWVVGFLVVTLLAGLLVAHVATSAVAGPLRQAVAAATASDLRAAAETHPGGEGARLDETGRLLVATRGVVDALAKVIDDVRGAKPDPSEAVVPRETRRTPGVGGFKN